MDRNALDFFLRGAKTRKSVEHLVTILDERNVIKYRCTVSHKT